MKIAQRFQRWGIRWLPSPRSGRLKSSCIPILDSVVRFTDSPIDSSSKPTDKSVGYYHSSAAPAFEAKPCGHDERLFRWSPLGSDHRLLSLQPFGLRSGLFAIPANTNLLHYCCTLPVHWRDPGVNVSQAICSEGPLHCVSHSRCFRFRGHQREQRRA